MFIRNLLPTLFRKDASRPLAIAMGIASTLPISSRKILLTACQMGEIDIRSLQHFPSSIRPLFLLDDIFYSKSDYCYYIGIAVSEPLTASILATHIKTCPEPVGQDESEAVRQEGFTSEFAATQQIFSDSQRVSYSAFFSSRRGASDPKGWLPTAHKIRRDFTEALRGKMLYPEVSRQKGLSDCTRAAYSQYDERDHVRSVDLEVFYHNTGIQVTGNPEVRSAWKFGHLKPRMYYCNGGDQYWTCRYMRKVAVALMEAIPSSFTKMRLNPENFLRSNFDTDYIITWDFSAFTSNLAELKHFLWYVARMCEADKVLVDLFDYHLGITRNIELYTLIDHYNENANMYPEYSIHRMLGLYVEGCGIDMQAVNNGLLGVHGNIGFSTALHGLVICKECGINRCVCVGDDGLGVTSEGPSRLVGVLSKLGPIHPEKFGVLPPGDNFTAMKFLKRRFERIDTGATKIGHMYNVPIPPYVDGEVGIRDVPIRFEMEDRIYKVATQASSVLWEVHGFGDTVTDREFTTLQDYLILAYKHLNLPLKGALPGSTIKLFVPRSSETKDHRLNFTIPPVTGYDYRKEDWLDHIINNAPVQYFRLRELVVDVPFDLCVEGEAGVFTENVHLSALEDLGYVTTEPIHRWAYIASVEGKAALRRMIRFVDRKSEGHAVYVKVVKDIPDRFLKHPQKIEDGTPWDGEEMEYY